MNMTPDDPLCNLCGLTCNLNGYPHGLVNARVSGGYSSTPGNGAGALDDLDIYNFSLCEFCLDWLFQQFVIQLTVNCVIDCPETPESWRPAKQRVEEDEWRKQKDRFFAEFTKRNEARKLK